jgi:hypothetical protein
LLVALSIGLAGCGGGGDTGIDEEIDLADPSPIQAEAEPEATPGTLADGADLIESDSSEADAVPVDAEPADPGLGDPTP